MRYRDKDSYYTFAIRAKEMDELKVQLRAKFFFDNGEVRRIDWVVVDPTITYGRASNPVVTPLNSIKEVKEEYKKYFLNLHKDKGIFSIENMNGDISGVDFRKVSYWTIKAIEMKDDLLHDTSEYSTID